MFSVRTRRILRPYGITVHGRLRIGRNHRTDFQRNTDWYALPQWWPNENGEITNSDFFMGDLKGITQKLDYLEAVSYTHLISRYAMNKAAQPDEDVEWSQATPGVDYLCFDLYMRSCV